MRAPTFRATVNHGVLTIVSWRPNLLGRGESAVVTEQRGRHGISFADLTVLDSGPGGRELFVDFLEKRMATEGAKELIAAWAANTEHRRVWFGDELRQLHDDACESGQLYTTCSTCGTEWIASGSDLRDEAREHGYFDPLCNVCAGLLPQWAEPRESAGSQ
jgi:hypothetical protein